MATSEAPIYVVDDDASVREAVGSLIRSTGLSVETFASAQEFLASRWVDVPSCLVLDVQLPGLSGLDLQQRLMSAGGQTSIIFLTGHGDIPTSVRAMKAGALEFLTKPFADTDLLDAIQQGLARAVAVSPQQPAAAERARVEAHGRAEHVDSRVRALIAATSSSSDHGRIIGRSEVWQQVLTRALQVAPTETTVFLQGESGTGKEVIARFVHRASPRKAGPFIAINCAALPEQLLESELFGYERGAFTGAQQSKPGQIELAANGVLFLDEVSEMSPMAQAKFLRFLQEREFQRLGGTRLLKANVRVIAASNRDLRQAVERGTFREDLFYRLQVFDITLPPLRERTSDIPLLADAFLQELARSMGRAPVALTEEALQTLMTHSWPGNVRELRNALERAAILSDDGRIARRHLSLHTNTTPSSATDLGAAERRTIEQVLRETDWNKSKAARRLGLTRTQLYVRMRRYALESPATT
jgi:DNA-binding NtrC family response regulator